MLFKKSADVVETYWYGGILLFVDGQIWYSGENQLGSFATWFEVQFNQRGASKKLLGAKSVRINEVIGWPSYRLQPWEVQGGTLRHLREIETLSGYMYTIKLKDGDYHVFLPDGE
jgi:hypothetical protein